MRLAGLMYLPLLAVMALWSGVARGEGERATVLLIDPGSAALTHRLRDEIEALGLDVKVVAPGEPGEPLEQRARLENAMGAVRITASGSGSVDMTIVDRTTGKTVSRHLAIAMPNDPASAELVATRTVELLRASLMELEAPHPPRGDAPVTPSVRDLAASTVEPRDATVAIATGPALVTNVAFGVSFDAFVALTFLAESGLGATARVLAPVTSAELDSAEGRVSVLAWQYRLGAALVGPRLGLSLSPRFEAGAALVSLTTDGVAEPSFVAVRENSLAWGPWASVGLQFELARRFALLAQGDATVLFPKTVIRSVGRNVATFGRPLVSASAGLQLAW